MKTAEDIYIEMFGVCPTPEKYGTALHSHHEMIRAMERYAAYLVDEKINKPSTVGFIESVKIEMAHQYEKWGNEEHKGLQHHTSVLSYLNGKLIRAIWDGDVPKIKHHLMTVAAVAGSAFNAFFPDEFKEK